MKTGLIMEGGAMRGMFTCGVIDVFMENGITFDGAIGVSAGAVFGCNIKSKQIGRAIRYNKKYCKNKRFCSIKSLLTTGDLYGVDFCYRAIPYALDLWDEKTFRENPMEFYVVCMDVTTGKPVYKKCEKGDENDLKWFRASASLPLASRVVEVDGYRLLDGGVADSVPLSYFEKIGYDRNVVILTQPMEYRKKPLSILPLAKILLHKYPKVIEAMTTRPERYNKQIAGIVQKEKEGKVLVIRPKEALQIGGMEKDPANLERVYQLGRKAGLENLSQVKEYLAVTKCAF